MRNAVAVAPVVEPRDDLGAGEGIGEVVRPHLHGRGPRHEELHRVLGGADAAHADDGDMHGMARLVHHAHGDGLDARARDAARRVGKQRLSFFDVDDHAREGIDEGDAVRPALFRRLRIECDALDIGRKLDDEGGVGKTLFGGARHFPDGLGTDAERHAPALYIGAGDVELDEIDEPVEPRADLSIVLDGAARDVGKDARFTLQPREIVLEKGVDARILQSHGVEDDAAPLRDARHGVAEAGL